MPPNMHYDETELRAMVEHALERVRTVLDTTKNPVWAADVPHRYDDKFVLAEHLTRMAIASAVQLLERAGIGNEQRKELRELAKNRAVTLRLRAEETCAFLREEKRQVESAETRVTEKTGDRKGKSTTTEKVITTVTEYLWRFDFRYELVAFQGTDESKAIVLHQRKGNVEIKTGAKTTPRPQSVARPSIDVDLGWILRHLDGEGRATFAIDRTVKTCHTPRRNEPIDAALKAFGALAEFCESTCGYFARDLFTAQKDHGLDLGALEDETILVPVLPLFEKEGKELLPSEYANAFLDEQKRALDEKTRQLEKVFPRNDSAITAAEATLMVTLVHVAKVCVAHAYGVDFIESMLRKQLIAAIGKELSPNDFGEYMDFHHRKLVKPQFRPAPFSHAIRRPEHYPEGVLGLELARDDGMPMPLMTIVASSSAPRPMTFPLDAATRVSFLGERHVHAFLAHQFSDSSELALSLVARARQFSSFILLVGRIASADSFEPKFGIILQNKDALTIPMMLETIPSPKEFRDAIASLSPEQQRFAKAFRGMQLESTLFGVCVIQIKPQLEKLLKLAPDALTKEIKLTQELLRLFIEYQIPSDLLSYDGPDDAPNADKLAKVKDYVARMFEMIELANKKAVEEAQQREAFRRAEADRTYVPPMPPPMPMAAPAGGPVPVMRSGIAGPLPQIQGNMSGPAMDFESVDMMLEEAPITAIPKASPQGTSGGSEPKRGTSTERATSGTSDDATDYTQIPTALDKNLDALDTDGAVRPAILHTDEPWNKSSQKGLLASPVETSLYVDEQETEKNRAFDLLDALSRSGTLPIDDASLHVVIAATHAFDKTLLDAVIQDNINPIEKVERSLMILSSTIHRLPATEILADDQRERFFTHSPTLGLPEKAD